MRVGMINSTLASNVTTLNIMYITFHQSMELLKEAIPIDYGFLHPDVKRFLCEKQESYSLDLQNLYFNSNGANYMFIHVKEYETEKWHRVDILMQ